MESLLLASKELGRQRESRREPNLEVSHHSQGARTGELQRAWKHATTLPAARDESDLLLGKARCASEGSFCA